MPDKSAVDNLDRWRQVVVAPDFAWRRRDRLREAGNAESVHRLDDDCGQPGTCSVIAVSGGSVRQLTRGRSRVHASGMFSVEQHRGLGEDLRMLQEPRAAFRAIVMMAVGSQEDETPPALFLRDLGE